MTILRDIGTIARALDSIANIEFREYNLAKGQYLYLTRIHENPGIIADKLAELLMVDRTTASRSIKKLEEHGFVRKEIDTTNKKIKRLFLTETGAALYPIIISENQYSTNVALNNLDEEDILKLTTLLEKMAVNIGKDWEKVKKGEKRPYKI